MELEEVKLILESIGLHKNEVSIYLDLIMAGRSSAMDISKRTKIHRPNVYDTLEKLIEKGMVTQNMRDNRKVFYPIEPKDLIHFLKQKEYDLQKIIPKIESLKSTPHELRKVTLAEGMPALRSNISHLLEFEKPIFILGMPKEEIDLFGGFIIDFHNQRIDKNLPLKIIYNGGFSKRVADLNKMSNTCARYLPSSYNSEITTFICGNKVILVLWKPPLSMILLECESVVKAYLQGFELIWESANLTLE